MTWISDPSIARHGIWPYFKSSGVCAGSRQDYFLRFYMFLQQMIDASDPEIMTIDTDRDTSQRAISNCPFATMALNEKKIQISEDCMIDPFDLRLREKVCQNCAMPCIVRSGFRGFERELECHNIKISDNLNIQIQDSGTWKNITTAFGQRSTETWDNRAQQKTTREDWLANQTNPNDIAQAMENLHGWASKGSLGFLHYLVHIKKAFEPYLQKLETLNPESAATLRTRYANMGSWHHIPFNPNVDLSEAALKKVKRRISHFCQQNYLKIKADPEASFEVVRGASGSTLWQLHICNKVLCDLVGYFPLDYPTYERIANLNFNATAQKTSNMTESRQAALESEWTCWAAGTDEDWGSIYLCEEPGCSTIIYADQDEWHEIDGTVYCNHCAPDHATQCRGCGRLLSEDEEWLCPRTENVFCEACWNQPNMLGCSRCTFVDCDRNVANIPEDEIFTDEAGHRHRIPPGHAVIDGRMQRIIDGHGHKPAPFFHGTEYNRKKPRQPELFLGIEDEIEVPSGRNEDRDRLSTNIFKAFAYYDGNPTLYLKSDGSLHHGFEIVTHPGTIEYHNDAFPWTRLCKMAVLGGARSHDTTTCGLHIHVNRDYFLETMWEDDEIYRARGSTMQNLKLAKLTHFVNDQRLRFYKLARRTATNWARYFDPKNAIAAYIEARKVDAQRKRKSTKDTVEAKYKVPIPPEILEYSYNTTGRRYEAVNLTNSSTVEFRIFKGSLNPATIRASIQLIHATVTFAPNLSYPQLYNHTKAWNMFKEYIEDNAKMYRHLITYMKNRDVWNGSIFADLTTDEAQLIEEGPECV